MDVGRRERRGKEPNKMKSRRKRSRWDIIFDILCGLNENGSMKKTHIMHYANTDWRNFRKYFDILVENGYIREHINGHSASYVITDKGKELLQRLEELKRMFRI